MPNNIGKHTLAGLKKEATAGTPVAVGAGDQIEVRSGLVVPAKEKINYAEDALADGISNSWKSYEMAKATLKTYLRFWGLEKLFGSFFGNIVTPVQQTNPIAYATEFKLANPETAMTFAFSKGEGSLTADILEVVELAGLLVRTFAISQGNNALADVDWEAVGKDLDYASSTNTSSTMPNLTMPDAS